MPTSARLEMVPTPWKHICGSTDGVKKNAPLHWAIPFQWAEVVRRIERVVLHRLVRERQEVLASHAKSSSGAGFLFLKRVRTLGVPPPPLHKPHACVQTGGGSQNPWRWAFMAFRWSDDPFASEVFLVDIVVQMAGWGTDRTGFRPLPSIFSSRNLII